MKKNNGTFIGIIVFVVVAILVLLMIPFMKDDVLEEKLLGIDYSKEGNDLDMNYKTDNPVVSLYIQNYGSVVIELYPEYAPNTVNNFIYLIKKKYYDNNTFHRLVPGFVLQGGDPNGTGSGGPGYSIKGEFSSNGVENNLKHTKGVISMARSDDKDSAGSQFFIMLDTAEYLDGNYAAFGKVIDGMNLVERIESKEKVADEESGQLSKNIVLKKAVVDLNKYDYKEPEMITEE